MRSTLVQETFLRAARAQKLLDRRRSSAGRSLAGEDSRQHSPDQWEKRVGKRRNRMTEDVLAPGLAMPEPEETPLIERRPVARIGNVTAAPARSSSCTRSMDAVLATHRFVAGHRRDHGSAGTCSRGLRELKRRLAELLGDKREHYRKRFAGRRSHPHRNCGFLLSKRSRCRAVWRPPCARSRTRSARGSVCPSGGTPRCPRCILVLGWRP